MKRLANISLVLMVLSGIMSSSSISILAQAPKVRTVAASKPAATPKCSGGWTGSVKYTRSQSMSDNKTVKRVSNRGEDRRRWEMKYKYSAVVGVVEDPSRPGASDGKASINHSFTSNDTTDAIESNSCDRGKTWKDMRGTFTSKSETTANASDVDANVHVGVNSNGTYAVSVGLPQIKGKTSGEQKSNFSGQCVPKEGKTLTMPATETSVDGNSLTSDGTHRVDPSDPNKLSGSYSKTWENVTETISWSLQKCGAPLRLTDLKFEDMKFPNWDDWQEIAEQKGTIDGNLVKIKATVLNASGELKYANVRFKETYKGDKWDGAKPDASLGDTLLMTRVAPGEAKEVELLWDSSGYSWFDDGRPRLVQRVRAELEESDKKVDEMTRNLKVAPKPLVLVHGLWSNWQAWEPWQNILTTSHSYDWKAFPVGEKADKGKMNTGGAFLSTDPTNGIADNAREVEKYIKYAQEDRNAWHVDIVAHSMGGLISRYYIDQIMPVDTKDGRPKVTKLVMLGTPNMGSPCADVMDFAFEILGKRVEAVRQLRTDYVEGFNKVITQNKGVKFSALAGNPLPTICKDVVWNDGVVTVPSAKWTIGDTAESKSIHTDLTGTKDFSDFVKPRVAVGPMGNHNPAMPNLSKGIGSFQQSGATPQGIFTKRVYGANSLAADDALPFVNGGTPAQPFAKAVKVGPKQTVEVEIPVGAARNFGLTFMADPLVSASLFNNTGGLVGKNLVGSPESRGWFRSIFVEGATTPGMWKLKLENTGDFEYEVIITSWANVGR